MNTEFVLQLGLEQCQKKLRDCDHPRQPLPPPMLGMITDHRYRPQIPWFLLLLMASLF